VTPHLADIFPIVLISALTALAVTPFWIRVSERLDLIDLPGSAPHKVHQNPIALSGGFVLVTGLIIAYLAVRPIVNQQVMAILLGGAVTFVFGVLDDRFDLTAWQKALGQVVAALILIALGVQVGITPWSGVNIGLTILWLIGMTNAMNFVDSMDGLALGLTVIASAFFALATLDAAQPELANLSGALLGVSLGVFFFNTSPARIFLGDSGSQFLGFMVAAIGIAYVPAQAGLPQGVSWFTPILVLGVPIFDMTLVVVSRLRRGKPIYRAGQDHTYHRLVNLGLESTRSVVAMHLVAVFLGLLAFIALGMTVLSANILFGIILVTGAGIIIWLESLESRRPS
jgi:UDP-GlcNAc:undecaprenyl-phosphate GlcNAc-1-phosphate transferase